MKKKFLIYVVVTITVLFLGFTCYYLAKNNEEMYMNLSSDESIFINVNDTIAWPIVWTKPYKDTTLSVSVGDETVLTYDATTKNFVGKSGGFTTVTIISSNKNFGPFVFEVYVGDGEQNSPFVLKTAEDLSKIGNDPQFSASKYYTLANDIDLKTFNNGTWAPLPEFLGNFDGNGKTIYNLSISTATNGGLFTSVAKNAVVENIKFDRVSTSGDFDALGIVAGVNKGLIGKVEIVSGTLTNTKDNSYTGGIAGINEYDSNPAYVNMCSVAISINTNGTAGGIVGFNKSSVVLNSRAIITDITSNTQSSYFGGIVGLNQSTYDAAETKFYPSAIVKSFAIIEKISASSIHGSIVGKDENNNNNNSMFDNKYQDVIFANADGVALNAIGENSTPMSSSAIASIKSTTKSELLDANTYTNFDLINVWCKGAQDYATINFMGNYETVIIKGLGTELNSSTMSLEAFLQQIRSDLANTTTYSVTENTTIDLGGKAWTTIAPLASSPMRASIIVEDGVTCVIKNFKLLDNNTSFFGYIAGNTTVKGITFEDVIIDNTADENTAVVATNLISGATLENIKVNNFSISTPAVNVGIISALNNGAIKNCEVASNQKVIVPAEEIQKRIGGIVGYNSGLITNCKTNQIKVEINTARNTEGNFTIGGIAGLTEKSINNCGVEKFDLQTTNRGLMYVGGVVGYTTNGTIEIYKCYSKATVDLGVNNEDAYLAGIVAYCAEGTTVRGSAYAVGTLRAYNVGGLTCIHYGTLTSSYSEGTLKGNKVAGLVTLCYNKVNNCYTLSTLVGDNSKSVVNGMTGLSHKDSLIDRCFSSATFQGEGTKYAETESPFRVLWIGKAIFYNSSTYNTGDLTNLIVINYGDAKTQYTIFGIKDALNDNPWIEATEEDCRGKDDYAVMREKAGFDGSVWNFENNGEYPTLRDIVEFEK